MGDGQVRALARHNPAGLAVGSLLAGLAVLSFLAGLAVRRFLAGLAVEGLLTGLALRRLLAGLALQRLLAIADRDHVDLLFAGIDRVESGGERFGLNALAGAGAGVVGLVGHHPHVPGLDADPARLLHLPARRHIGLPLDLLHLVGVRVHPVPPRAVDPPECSLAGRLAQLPLDQELAVPQASRPRGWVAPHQAGHHRQLPGLDHHVLDQGPLPPEGAVEVPTRPRHFHQHPHLEGLAAGQLPRLRGVAPPQQQRSLVPQQQALARRDEDAVDRPVHNLPRGAAQQGHQRQQLDTGFE